MSRSLQMFDESRLRALLARFSEMRVAVLGDFFLDKYLDLDSSLAELSLETGRLAHQVIAVRHAPGAAGTVVNNLAALGAGRIVLVGFTGDDGEGWELRRDLAALGCGLEHLHVAKARATPTYIKPRDGAIPGLAGEHDRYDIKNRQPAPAEVEQALLRSLQTVLPEIDALMIMDQVTEEGTGALSAPVIAAVSEAAERHPDIIFWADSRGRCRRFRHVTVKVNQFELAGIGNPKPDDRVPDEIVAEQIEVLAAALGAPVFATVGARGVRVSGSDAALVPAVRVEGTVDPTGAGDAFSAGAVLALAAAATRLEAALVGNLAASVTIRQLGTTGTARPADLLRALALWKEQQA